MPEPPSSARRPPAASAPETGRARGCRAAPGGKPHRPKNRIGSAKDVQAVAASTSAAFLMCPQRRAIHAQKREAQQGKDRLGDERLEQRVERRHHERDQHHRRNGTGALAPKPGQERRQGIENRHGGELRCAGGGSPSRRSLFRQARRTQRFNERHGEDRHATDPGALACAAEIRLKLEHPCSAAAFASSMRPSLASAAAKNIWEMLKPGLLRIARRAAFAASSYRPFRKWPILMPCKAAVIHGSNGLRRIPRSPHSMARSASPPQPKMSAPRKVCPGRRGRDRKRPTPIPPEPKRHHVRPDRSQSRRKRGLRHRPDPARLQNERAVWLRCEFPLAFRRGCIIFHGRTPLGRAQAHSWGPTKSLDPRNGSACDAPSGIPVSANGVARSTRS